MHATVSGGHGAPRATGSRGLETTRELCVVGMLFVLTLGHLLAPRAVAQQVASPRRIGVLGLGPAQRPFVEAFLHGLQDVGYVAGQNLTIEERFASGDAERFPALAAELVQLPVAVIFARGPAALQAAKQATETIPIVAIDLESEPVQRGYAASLVRPGGNITGQILRDRELRGKRLELLKEAAPTITHVALLNDPNIPADAPAASDFEQEVRALGVQLQRVEAGTPAAISDALATIAHSGAEALMIMDSAMFNTHRQQILDFARTQRLPTVCGVRVYAEAGCLIAYAPDVLAMFRRAAVFVDKILQGKKPGDIPLEPPHQLKLVVNLTTAQALGLTLSPALLLQADEVIR